MSSHRWLLTRWSSQCALHCRHIHSAKAQYVEMCLAGQVNRAHPVHQPELDAPGLRRAAESYETTNQSYGSKKA